eukprot:4323011-Prymnesium_polylepis.1
MLLHRSRLVFRSFRESRMIPKCPGFRIRSIGWHPAPGPCASRTHSRDPHFVFKLRVVFVFPHQLCEGFCADLV